MLDPSRLPLDATTVGFRKRMRQPVDEAAFNLELQRQTDCIKVRREEKETPISEVHVMGGQLFGIGGNSKTNEFARQQRQIHGYPLRTFSASGPMVLPSKHIHGLLQTPVNLGLTQYVPRGVGVIGDYVSRFTEPDVSHMGQENFPEKRDLQRTLEETYAKRQANLAEWQNIKSQTYQNELRRAANQPNAAAAVERIEAVVENQNQRIALPQGVRNVPIRAEIGAEFGAVLRERRKRAGGQTLMVDEAAQKRAYQIAALEFNKAKREARLRREEANYEERIASGKARAVSVPRSNLYNALAREADAAENYVSAEAPPVYAAQQQIAAESAMETPVSRRQSGSTTGESRGSRSTGQLTTVPITPIIGRNSKVNPELFSAAGGRPPAEPPSTMDRIYARVRAASRTVAPEDPRTI